MADKDEITITLPKDAALVLFEFGYRIIEELESDRTITIDKGEEGAISDLVAKIEPLLVEPFMENYNALLSQAKEQCKRRLYGDDEP